MGTLIGYESTTTGKEYILIPLLDKPLSLNDYLPDNYQGIVIDLDCGNPNIKIMVKGVWITQHLSEENVKKIIELIKPQIIGTEW